MKNLKNKLMFAAFAFFLCGILYATQSLSGWGSGSFRKNNTTSEMILGTFEVDPATGAPSGVPTPIAGPAGSVVLRPVTYAGGVTLTAGTAWQSFGVSSTAGVAGAGHVYRIELAVTNAGTGKFIRDSSAADPAWDGRDLTKGMGSVQYNDVAYNDVVHWYSDGTAKGWLKVWEVK